MSEEGKFLGGAKMARLNARKRANATRILRPGETLNPPDYLSKKMPPMERFFASLFKSPASEFVKKDTGTKLIGDVCRRLGLAPPSSIQVEYKNASAHFDCRAALVMEESRHAISEALSSLWRGNKGRNNGIRVTLKSMETRKEPGHVVFCFEKNIPFIPRELCDIRPGCCFEILPPGTVSIERSLLACVVSKSRVFDDEGTRQEKRILLMVFAPFDELPSGGQWRIRPVAALISNLRQFEACTNAKNVPFLYALLGRKGATHTRFRHSDDEGSDGSHDNEDEKKEDDVIVLDGNDEIVSTDKVFNLPVLNRTQESASHTFLRSGHGTITVVHGPPGTGKTELLVSIICRYLMQSASRGVKRRLMVCAPTNKAVTVLVTRYLESARNSNQNPFNAVLVGEQEKLLHEEQFLLETHETTCPAFRVRSIFAYTWLHGVVEDCRYIQHKLKNGHADVGDIVNRILVLCSRITGSLTYSILDITLVGLLDLIRDSAKTAANGGDHPLSYYCNLWCRLLDDLVNAIHLMNPDVVVRELMETADVIFCTLASAGSSVVKYSRAIDDLIVDEAAAATEPELYIPFNLNPSRLLVVGDPMQLPATVFSRTAERMGLGKSLHERLMYDLGCDHIMLDVQYRMRPEISRFPSLRFYQGRIANGDNVTSPLYKNTVSLLNGNPYVFLQVEGTEQEGFGGSYNNSAEAEAIAELVKQLRRDEAEWYSADKIRIITFYQAQVSLLKRILSDRGLGNIVVATVDSSQGCEADIVIVSFVRSISGSGQGRKFTAGFLQDDRRLNVALTRAKFQLVCVGNNEGLKRLPESSTLNALSYDATERECVCPLMFLGHFANDKTGGGNKRDGNDKKNKGGKRGGKSRKRRKSRHEQLGSQNHKPNKREKTVF